MQNSELPQRTPEPLVSTKGAPPVNPRIVAPKQGPTKKSEFKQMSARLAKIPEAGEYLAYFPVSGIEYNAAIAA